MNIHEKSKEAHFRTINLKYVVSYYIISQNRGQITVWSSLVRYHITGIILHKIDTVKIKGVKLQFKYSNNNNKVSYYTSKLTPTRLISPVLK